METITTIDEHIPIKYKPFLWIVGFLATGVSLGIQSVVQWLSEHEIPKWVSSDLQPIAFGVTIIAGVVTILRKPKK